MWFKVDDGLPFHRKIRAVLKGHTKKRRDAATMGVWVLAGAWAGKHKTDGWVPEEELDRWDDDWESIAERLVASNLWHPAERDGEPGYQFHEWFEHQPESRRASDDGSYGNHVRWHVSRGIVAPDCDLCPTDPLDAADPPDAPEDGHPIAPPSPPDGSPPDRHPIAPANRRPDRVLSPTPNPNPKPVESEQARSLAHRRVEREREPVATGQSSQNPTPTPRDTLAADFADWWAAYPRKRGKGQALRAYRTARKKTTAEELLTAISQQSKSLTARGAEYCPYPATWLNGERWTDQPDPTSRAPAKVSAREEMFQRQLERAQLKEQQMGIRQ